MNESQIDMNNNGWLDIGLIFSKFYSFQIVKQFKTASKKRGLPIGKPLFIFDYVLITCCCAGNL